MNVSKLEVLFGVKGMRSKDSSEPNGFKSRYLNTLDSSVSRTLRPMGANYFIKATTRSPSHLYLGTTFES
ncbi:uncharacterized protein Bfra_010120 [Botrytis fragariae]|uniref:Uncharacterized protein n=1 Tax=Botrytis fragariae TaxID=1964551 RepID=A0A8H6AMH8_9HELO|nr:uncharacterized protein Bfra_010120 [Botrytis fragariae]KAF5869975.1 hypothetical protein Bfra_010120 [Botrytis fragariae]